jgi:hypothetical protein
MRYREVYRSLVDAVAEGRLTEPFSSVDFRRACPGFLEGTYRAFLWKHSSGRGGETRGADVALLERTAPGKFRLIRPFKSDF